MENTIAASLEDFDFVVEAFGKAPLLSTKERIGNLFPPRTEEPQEIIKTTPLRS